MNTTAQLWWRKISALLLMVVTTACTSTVSHDEARSLSTEQIKSQQSQQVTKEKKVGEKFGTVAVAKVAIDHPSARLVYKDSGVSDTIVRHMNDTGNFRIIDWANLQQVLFRRNLVWSDLQQDKNVGKTIRDVLLNDYFLMGTVTSYGERMEYDSSAFTKSKIQIASATVELALQDALSNEIVASVKGNGEKSRQIKQTLGFGAAGGIDTGLANAVLDLAIGDAVAKLGVEISGRARPAPALASDSKGSQDNAAPVVFSGNPKVLFIFSEEDEGKRETSREKAGEIGISVVEQAMAKAFSDAGCRVMTAEDVVNKAYGIGSGENIIQGGWVTEKEMRELENLLQARTGIASFALQVGKSAKADIVIIGTVRHETQKNEGPGGIASKMSTAFITAKAIAVADGKTMLIKMTDQEYMAVQNPSELKARTNALTLASRKLALEFLQALQHR